MDGYGIAKEKYKKIDLYYLLDYNQMQDDDI